MRPTSLLKNAPKALADPVARFDVEYSAPALELLVSASGGYPYFLQELGSAAWELSADSPITIKDAESAIVVGLERLDQGFFRSRWERATTAERKMLLAMAADAGSPTLTSEVATRMGVKPSSIGPYRARLMHKGLIYAPEHSYVAFTVPGMAAFIERHRDDADSC